MLTRSHCLSILGINNDNPAYFMNPAWKNLAHSKVETINFLVCINPLNTNLKQRNTRKKKLTSLIILLLVGIIYLKAQAPISSLDTSSIPFDPMYVLENSNGKPTFHEFIILGPHDEKSFSILNNEDAEQKYGFKNLEYGARVVRVMLGVKFFTINQLLELFHIEKNDQQLPVYIDSLDFRNVRTIVAVKHEIIDVKVLTDNSKGRYIHITTITGTKMHKEKFNIYERKPITITNY